MFSPRIAARFAPILVLALAPVLFLLITFTGLIDTDGVQIYSGLQYEGRSLAVRGEPTIDPNYGFTSQALGRRAAEDVLAGKVPVWNHYEGLGAPLLGGMQGAALFPFTWLLALPNGQVIEQALLQFIAGLGAYLLLRLFGVGRGVAVVCGVVFSLNGVFAWMRFAIFNTVPFLPWIFLSIEQLYRAALQPTPFVRRLSPILTGGVAAALALYGGFPEAVFFYAMMLALWVCLRLAMVPASSRLRCVGDLALVGLLALLLSLPALLSFAAYLPHAALAGHSGHGFYGAYLPEPALLQYALPYVYGPIFASSQTVIQVVWGNIGGYIGLVPLFLALVALFMPGRRVIKAFLAAWIFISVGVSVGLPGVYEAFLHIPLVSIAASFRYMNAGWTICFVILAGLGLRDIARGDPQRVRRAMWASLAGTLIFLIGAAVFAGPPLFPSANDPSAVRTFFYLSLGIAAVLLVGFAVLAGRAKPAGAAFILAMVLIAEAVFNFAVPYLSYPRRGKLDVAALEFLREGIGFSRVVATDGGQLAPNYGSYFGIAALNWNNIPSPRATVDFVRDELDPIGSDGIYFLPEGMNLTPAQREERWRMLQARLDRYAAAGVRYILARRAPGGVTLVALENAAQAEPLDVGGRIAFEARVPGTGQTRLAGLSVLIGTHHGKANGLLAAELCQGQTCARGTAPLVGAADNAHLRIPFEAPFALDMGQPFTLAFTKEGGDHAVAVWLSPVAAARAGVEVGMTAPRAQPDLAPSVRFDTDMADRIRLVHKAKNFDIYEIAGVRPYFEAPGCTVQSTDRDVAKVECAAPSRLTRLELAMAGWEARVNGQSADVETVDRVFQQVAVPAGTSTVTFRFRPLYLSQALMIALVTLFAVVVAAGVLVARRVFRERDDGAR